MRQQMSMHNCIKPERGLQRCWTANMRKPSCFPALTYLLCELWYYIRINWNESWLHRVVSLLSSIQAASPRPSRGRVSPAIRPRNQFLGRCGTVISASSWLSSFWRQSVYSSRWFAAWAWGVARRTTTPKRSALLRLKSKFILSYLSIYINI